MTPIARAAAGSGIVTPLSPSSLRQTAALVRTIAQSGDAYEITNASDPAPTFRCALLPSKTYSAPTSDTAPRVWRNKLELFYLARTLGQASAVYEPGARFTVEEVEYEAVSESLARRSGIAVWAYVVRVLPVSQLWPLSATLADLKGDPVPDVPSIPFAVWEGTTDRNTQRGRYDDTEGEVPPEFADVVKGTNLSLVVDTRKYKIQSVHKHFSQPHVSMRLVSLDA